MLQWIMRALLLISVISAIAASLTLDIYTPQTPKRLFLQHMIRVAANGEQESLYAAASSDATPVDVVLKGMNLTPAQQDGREWLVRIFVLSTCLLDVTKLFPAFEKEREKGPFSSVSLGKACLLPYSTACNANRHTCSREIKENSPGFILLFEGGKCCKV